MRSQIPFGILMKKRKKKYVKGDIDAEAAAIILQDFIEGFKEPEARSF